ncbi:MAG: hypothetical protein ACOY3H_07950 [Bacillota bacterium]
MSDWQLDLRNLHGQKKVERVKEVVSQVGPVDTLNIVFDRVDPVFTDEVVDILEENGFAWQPKGSEEGYYIQARRLH